MHPSIDPGFDLAYVTTLEVEEFAGGSADWTLARMQFFVKGQEVSHADLGMDALRAAGVTRVNPMSVVRYKLIFRSSVPDFDTIGLTATFTDVSSGHAVTTVNPRIDFGGIAVSLTPALRAAPVPATAP